MESEMVLVTALALATASGARSEMESEMVLLTQLVLATA